MQSKISSTLSFQRIAYLIKALPILQVEKQPFWKEKNLLKNTLITL